jgi:UDP-N-acetyl-D-mannosaminuronic acid dehydrogenase
MWFYSGSKGSFAVDRKQKEVLSTTYISYHGLGLGVPMYMVSNAEIAETTKVVENAHRYLQIAFAEELYLYCQDNNINFPELRDALNTKWNVEILEPREGIGGHCLPKDTRMFLESSSPRKNKILTAAMEADEDYQKFRAIQEKDIDSSYFIKPKVKCIS